MAMLTACGAVSKADHEKIQAELNDTQEAQNETESKLKDETKARKEVEKTVESTKKAVETASEAKEKLDSDNKKLQKDSEKKAADLEKTKKQLEKVKGEQSELKKEVENAKQAKQEAEERAKKAEDELAQRIAEEELAAKAAAEAAALAAEEAGPTESEEAKEEDVGEKKSNKKKEKKTKIKDESETKERLPSTWSTGLCTCCAKPGGVGLCFKTFFCPCWTLGRINAYLKNEEAAPCPGGCFGGCCLGCCCTPCYMCKAAPRVAEKVGNGQESKCKAFLKTCCCTCCYIEQVYRETLILEDPESAPVQQTMGGGGGGEKWSTGLVKCCAKPGGVKLCCKTFCCPCLVTGALNATLKEESTSACPGGKCGGCCLGCVCLPCFMCRAAPRVAELTEKQESKGKACCKTLCCPCCFLEQVYRETLIMHGEG